MALHYSYLEGWRQRVYVRQAALHGRHLGGVKVLRRLLQHL